MSAIAVIQATQADLLDDDRDPAHYCIAALRGSRCLDRIVIAAPRSRGGQALLDAANAWDIDCYLGSDLDVTGRIIEAARSVGAVDDTIIARVLLNRYYLDVDLVDRMVELLRQSGSDYVRLPYDFNINFGADTLTLACLRRAAELIHPTDTARRFRPWLFIEEHSEAFRVTCLEDVPTYPLEKLWLIRGSDLARERDCCRFAALSYEFVLQFVRPTDTVLDVGCGLGEGSALLARRVAEVWGIDYDKQVVAEARSRHNLGNIRFELQDAHALTYEDEAVDVVVCSNVMEHLADDVLFLQNCRRVLRSGGRLILEVPLLAERPFGVPLIPSHIREYRPAPLLELVEQAGFVVESKFGVNRGLFVEWDRAREGALIVANRR